MKIFRSLASNGNADEQLFSEIQRRFEESGARRDRATRRAREFRRDSAPARVDRITQQRGKRS